MTSAKDSAWKPISAGDGTSDPRPEPATDACIAPATSALCTAFSQELLKNLSSSLLEIHELACRDMLDVPTSSVTPNEKGSAWRRRGIDVAREDSASSQSGDAQSGDAQPGLDKTTSPADASAFVAAFIRELRNDFVSQWLALQSAYPDSDFGKKLWANAAVDFRSLLVHMDREMSELARWSRHDEAGNRGVADGEKKEPPSRPPGGGKEEGVGSDG